MEIKNLPRTLALIPDGNRRWAASHRLSILNGYDNGVKKFIDFSEWCLSYGINNIAVWAFSTENFARSNREVNTLFRIYRRVAKDRDILDRLHRNRTRLSMVGNMSLLPKDLLSALRNVEEETKCYKERVINMLVSYGGKDDIMHAVREIAGKARRYRDVTEDLFGRHLLTSGLPEIDFLIRTSGEQRLSGFMPWQTSYSELYFSDKLWPDFTREDLHAALSEYSARQRRFGR